MSSSRGKYQSLFSAGDDVYANACVNWLDDRLELYAVAYKRAADKLAVDVVESAQYQDSLVYPIVFLYRQYLELRLKEIIKEGRKLLTEPGQFPAHHEVDKLWSLAKNILAKVFSDDEEKPDFSLIDHVVAEFVVYDRYSFSFRYPTDKSGKNPLQDLSHINIRNVAEMINGAGDLLDAASTAISVYRDWQNEMNAQRY